MLENSFFYISSLKIIISLLVTFSYVSSYFYLIRLVPVYAAVLN